MITNKDDTLERKRGVVALYLMGNIPEKISEKLAIPVKNVRKDLRSMGIASTEEAGKTEIQVLREVRHEAELMKQELWEMYLASKTIEEKVKILAEIRQILEIKSETAGQIVKPGPVSRPAIYEKSLWSEVKENFFSKSGNGQKIEKEIIETPAENGGDAKPTGFAPNEAKTPELIEIIEMLQNPMPTPDSCIVKGGAKMTELRNILEEAPSKAYKITEKWNRPCEGIEELEIVEIKGDQRD